MDICADEYERARSVPVMIPLGRGLWNTIRRDNGSTPAAYTMPTLGTHLALALWPESADGERSTSPGVTQDVAHEVRRAAQVTAIAEAEEGDPIQIHSQYNHGSGNVMIALGPGDMITTAVSNGGTINIRNACESMHPSLTQHAWTVIRHPIQANLQAARHNIDASAQIGLESVTGTVWHYQRRRQPDTRYMDPETATGTAEQNTPAAGGSTGQSRPSEEVNPRAPGTTSASTLSGPLQHLSYVQWESADNAPPVDNNPSWLTWPERLPEKPWYHLELGPLQTWYKLSQHGSSAASELDAQHELQITGGPSPLYVGSLHVQCVTTAASKDSVHAPWHRTLV